MRTKQFGQCDLIRPLSQKFGIGYYFDGENPQFMDAFEVAVLQSEAEQNRQAEQAAKQQRQEHDERLKAIEQQRLEEIVPDDAKAVIVAETAINNTPEAITGDYVIVDYSEKALAVFGDTRAIKDRLKAWGGRFNPKLTHEGQKKAGWIFSKSKEQEVKNLLTVK
ncbi:MAG: hypothetical protein LBB73_02670 [Dysgonamonadaceae bacterium]|nr:hypothetical protein [Dysgonamonadaceae bacterium]